MKQMGTTLVETKSGYGLDLETEVKMMRVMKRANDNHDLDLVVNYCGAHVILFLLNFRLFLKVLMK